MQRLARFCYRRRRSVLTAWILAAVGLMFLSSVAGGVFKINFDLPNSESQRAVDILVEQGVTDRTGDQWQVVFETEQGVNDPEVQTAMESFLTDIEENIDGVQVISPYSEEGARQVAQGGQIAYAEINLSDRESSQYTDD